MQSLSNLPKEVQAPFEIGILGAFFEPSQDAETSFTRQQERLIAELVSVLSTQLLALVGARSGEEFRNVRGEVWPKYIRALRALHDTASNLVGEDQIEHMSKEGLEDLASDVRKQTSRFGSALTEQALFTLWTIGKIRSLGHKIEALAAPPEEREADREIFSEYRANCLWAQFHLDTLVTAIRFDRPVAEEMRETICDGLRVAVNAYAVMKEALLLRQPHTDTGTQPTASTLPWDDEDERLLAASMRDVNADFSDDH